MRLGSASKLRSSPAFQRDLRDLPHSYRAGRSEFPWEPVREDGGGLATAFSAQLSVEDMRETLPQPEMSLLSDISSKCTQSFRLGFISFTSLCTVSSIKSHIFFLQFEQF